METAQVLPPEEDLRRWAAAMRAPDQVRASIVEARAGYAMAPASLRQSILDTAAQVKAGLGVVGAGTVRRVPGACVGGDSVVRRRPGVAGLRPLCPRLPRRARGARAHHLGHAVRPAAARRAVRATARSSRFFRAALAEHSCGG